MGTRDSQRSKVYTAEHVFSGDRIKLLSVDEAQAFVNSVIRSAWWKRRTNIRYVEVKPGARGGRAWAFSNSIVTSPGGRTQWIMLHELAHVMTGSYNIQPHGPEFCANFVELTRQFLSKEEGDALKASFRAHRVKVRGAAKATRKISTTCHGCDRTFTIGTGWRTSGLPVSVGEFHSKSCAVAWFTKRLKQS